jgi:hypothetical protein
VSDYRQSNGTGYYRVDYAPSLLGELSTIAPKLSEEDRFTLITDCWATVQLGQADGSALLNLMTNLKGDRSVIVCDAMSRVFSIMIDLKLRKNELVFGLSPAQFSGRCSMPLVGPRKKVNHGIRPGCDRI